MKHLVVIVVLILTASCFGKNLQKENLDLQLKISELEGKLADKDKAIKKLREKLADKTLEVRRLERLCEENGIDPDEKPKSKRGPSKVALLQKNISKTLGLSDRGLPDRLVELKANNLGLKVSWAINRNHTEDGNNRYYRRDKALEDVRNIAKVIQQSKLPPNNIIFHGYYDVKGKLGNRVEQVVITQTIPANVFKSIDFSSLSPKEFAQIGNTTIVVKGWNEK